MSQFRRGGNRLARCRCCGKLSHSHTGGSANIDLCRVCFDSAGQWNAHSDGTPHDESSKEYCPTCAGVDCLHELTKVGAA